MKKLFYFTTLFIALTSCNKDDNTDYFCEAVNAKDWATLVPFFKSDAAGRGHEQWQLNAHEFARIVSERECVDTAYAMGSYLETEPQSTEVIVEFIGDNDTIMQMSVILQLDESTGDISYLGKVDPK